MKFVGLQMILTFQNDFPHNDCDWMSFFWFESPFDENISQNMKF